MKRENLLPALMLLGICWLPLHPVAGQENKDRPALKAADEDLEIRAYRVADLLIATPSYPYDGQDLPTVGRRQTLTGGMGMGGMGMGGMGMGGSMGGGMGGGMGGYMGGYMGGGMGGGMGGTGASTSGAQAPQSGGLGGGGRGMEIAMGGWRPVGHGSSPLFNGPDELIEAVTMLVEPQSWDGLGGPASLTVFGGLLLVNQTPEIHEKIDELLETIRSEGTAAQTVVVEARWLLLDADQLDDLLDRDATKSDGKSPLTVDPAACERLSRELPGHRGRITCFSGQTVHLVSGSRRSVVTGAVPVVGSGIGYQPITFAPNVGVLLQVTPSLLPGSDAAVLDVQSTVTGWVEPEPIRFVGSDLPATRKLDPASQEPTHQPGGATTLTLDRLDIPALELATALRVPLDKPVLVGGLTLDPTETAADDETKANRKVLYLVVRVSAAESGRSD